MHPPGLVQRLLCASRDPITLRVRPGLRALVRSCGQKLPTLGRHLGDGGEVVSQVMRLKLGELKRKEFSLPLTVGGPP